MAEEKEKVKRASARAPTPPGVSSEAYQQYLDDPNKPTIEEILKELDRTKDYRTVFLGGDLNYRVQLPPLTGVTSEEAEKFRKKYGTLGPIYTEVQIVDSEIRDVHYHSLGMPGRGKVFYVDEA